MSKTAVEFKDVVKTYGKGDGMQTAVDHVSFTIDEGEFVVILGQSGAGKSTVLNMLGGMDTPTEGKVIVDGQEISSYSDKKLSAYRADTIGFIFQFYNLIPGLTAYENVALVKDIKKNALDANEMLDRVGLADQKHKFPSQMSGGSVCYGCIGACGLYVLKADKANRYGRCTERNGMICIKQL